MLVFYIAPQMCKENTEALVMHFGVVLIDILRYVANLA